jgi:4-diphosphocytidyl-2-C-methyl-D-erythritol kinase
MIVFPQAKINLGLNILGKRADGFHNLQSVFLSVNLYDALEVIIDKNMPFGEMVFSTSGIAIPGDQKNNLILKAAHLYNELVSLPGIRIHLHKNIPMGAGMGGGSSNGAWMLRLLNRLMDNALNSSQLFNLATQLGSDCPFFLYDSPCYVTGRGEVLEPIALDLKGWNLVLINPGIHISTAEAFRMILPIPNTTNLKSVVSDPIDLWNINLYNDFEKPACLKYEEIKEALAMLKKLGASYSAMTGTGSTVFGLFEVMPNLQNLPDHWFVHSSQF